MDAVQWCLHWQPEFCHNQRRRRLPQLSMQEKPWVNTWKIINNRTLRGKSLKGWIFFLHLQAFYSNNFIQITGWTKSIMNFTPLIYKQFEFALCVVCMMSRRVTCVNFGLAILCKCLGIIEQCALTFNTRTHTHTHTHAHTRTHLIIKIKQGKSKTKTTTLFLAKVWSIKCPTLKQNTLYDYHICLSQQKKNSLILKYKINQTSLKDPSF